MERRHSDGAERTLEENMLRDWIRAIWLRLEFETPPSR
jgi:hypothetical protein